jgi:hypothetical protein
VQTWLNSRPNVHLHFTPDVRLLAELSGDLAGYDHAGLPRRGTFRSTPDLVHKVMIYIRLYNRNAQPFR